MRRTKEGNALILSYLFSRWYTIERKRIGKMLWCDVYFPTLIQETGLGYNRINQYLNILNTQGIIKKRILKKKVYYTIPKGGVNYHDKSIEI